MPVEDEPEAGVPMEELPIDDMTPEEMEQMSPEEIDMEKDAQITGAESAMPIETKAVLETDVPIGDQTFQLFKDFDTHDGEFFYLVLPSAGKMLGFLANQQGDLVDL